MRLHAGWLSTLRLSRCPKKLEWTPVVSLLKLKKYNVGIINIEGSLFSKSSWYTKWMDLTSYDDIRSALVQAAENDSIDTILLKIDSPGGAAAGVDDVSNLINKIKADKNVISFTDRQMASAAYWIGASANKIYSTRMADVGSIGVVTVHQEITKMLDEYGIKATVLRSAEYKALGGPMEKLSDKAKTMIQDRLDALHDEFVTHVSLSLGIPPAKVSEDIANGKTYLGYDALKLGMVHGITTIDDLIGKLTQKAQSNHNSSYNSFESSPLTEITSMEASDVKRTKVLTNQTQAAILAGASVDTAIDQQPETITTAGSNPGEGTGEATAQPAVEAESGATETKESSEEAVEAKADTGLVDYLKAELAQKDEKLVEATIELKETKKKLEEMQASHASMRGIVADATNHRHVALNRSTVDFTNTSDDSLLQQFHAADKDFKDKFPIGMKAESRSVEPVQGVTSLHKHKVAATRSK